MKCITTDGDNSMIVRIVANVLDKLISGNQTMNMQNQGIQGFIKFQSSYAPEVTIESYLERIRKYSRCSEACIVLALIFVDRLIEKRNLVLSSLNVHRLIITSVMIAAKFHDDLFYNNAYFSKLGGICLQELNMLEVEMLNLLEYRLFVDSASFNKYSLQLQNYILYLSVSTSPSLPQKPFEPPFSPNTVSVLSPLKTSLSHPAPVPFSHEAAPVFGAFSPPHLAAAFQNNAPGYYFNFPVAPHQVPRIPSPNNPHAKANGISDYYVTASSPCHLDQAAHFGSNSNSCDSMDSLMSVAPTLGHYPYQGGQDLNQGGVHLNQGGVPMNYGGVSVPTMHHHHQQVQQQNAFLKQQELRRLSQQQWGSVAPSHHLHQPPVYFQGQHAGPRIVGTGDPRVFYEVPFLQSVGAFQGPSYAFKVAPVRI